MSHAYFKGLGHGPADIVPGIEVFDEQGERLGTVEEVRDHYVHVARPYKPDGWLPESAFAHQQDGRLYAGFPARRWDEFALQSPGGTNLHTAGMAGEEVGVPMSSGADERQDSPREDVDTAKDLGDVTPAARHSRPEP